MHAARRLLVAVAALVALGLLAAAPALAGSAFDTLFHEYQSTGSIKACQHSTAQLQAAKNEVPPDITQYAPDFPAALQAALEARAHGVCGGAAAAGASAGGGAVGGAATPGAPGSSTTGIPSGTAAGPTPYPIGSAAGASPIARAAADAGGGGASSAPAPLIALAVLLTLLALAAVWWTVTTLRGTEAARTSAAGHALGEVRLRAGGTLREFADWLRLGR